MHRSRLDRMHASQSAKMMTAVVAMAGFMTEFVDRRRGMAGVRLEDPETEAPESQPL